MTQAEREVVSLTVFLEARGEPKARVDWRHLGH